MISFETNTLKSRRKVVIDGREYVVRRYGNIERMEVFRLQDEIKEILSKYPKDVKDDEISPEDLKTITLKAEQASNTLIGLFDDGTKDQRHAKALVRSLEEDDVADILSKVFDDGKAS